jgi:hypothetical protein
LVAFGAGIKVYPGLLFPVFAALAWQRGSAHLKRLVLGCSLVALPLIVAAPWLPWWQFASFHAERGLQVESLLASIVWALHFAGVPAGWEFIRTSNDVTGPVAAALVQPGRLFWCAASIACVVVASQAALRLGASTSHARSLPHVAALALLPVLAFVSTNTIFSPQFHVWLVPLAAAMFYARPTASDPAVQSPDGLPALALRAALCILLATFIVPVFYPHREYALGLGLFRTVMLVLRNLLLLYALGCLWWATRSMGRVPSRMSTQAFEPVR